MIKTSKDVERRIVNKIDSHIIHLKDPMYRYSDFFVGVRVGLLHARKMVTDLTYELEIDELLSCKEKIKKEGRVPMIKS